MKIQFLLLSAVLGCKSPADAFKDVAKPFVDVHNAVNDAIYTPFKETIIDPIDKEIVDPVKGALGIPDWLSDRLRPAVLKPWNNPFFEQIQGLGRNDLEDIPLWRSGKK
jgi:hypothetical protein